MDNLEPLNKAEKKAVKSEQKIQEKQNLEMRDILAIDRTKLANERTFLSYLRTAMALVLSGLTFLKVFGQDLFYILLAISFIGVGLGIVAFGYYRFSRKKRKVSALAHVYTPTSPVVAQVVEQEEKEAGSWTASDPVK